MDIKEIYNVSNKEIEEDARVVKIYSTDIPGYIGFLFNTHRVQQKEIEAQIQIQFIKNDKIIFSSSKKCDLFHPELEIIHTPENIVVQGNRVSDTIRLKRNGYGTLLIRLEELSDNTVSIQIPPEIMKTLINFTTNFKNRIRDLKKKYPEHECQSLLDAMVKNDFEMVDDSLDPLDKYYDEVKDKNEFINDIGRAFTSAYLETINIQTTIVDPMIKYFESAAAKNIIILDNIFKSVYFEGGEQTLHVKVKAVDLLGQKYPDIELPPIPIEGEKGNSVELKSLFSFEEE